MKQICITIFALLLFPWQKALGQTDPYASDYKDYSVQVKPAKWHDLKNEFQLGSADKFDSREYWELSRGHVQATHTIVDTLYMHKGETVNLYLPDRLRPNKNTSNNQYSIRTYQRWYDFRRLSTFEVKNATESWNYTDLLICPDRKGFRMANGYVGSPLLGINDYAVLGYMQFHFPTDEEFEQMFPGNTDSELDNKYYLIACDVSGYKDFTSKYEKETSKNSNFSNGFWEPTLSHRVIFYISQVDDNENTAYVKKWKKGIADGTMTSSDESTNSYMEESEINFPSIRRASKTNELCVLTKEARGYAIPGVNDNQKTPLKVGLVDNTAGISLVTTSLQDENTVIYFNYPANDEVPDKSKATIIVYKEVGGTRYNVGRYKITFSKDGLLLTQSEVAANQETGKEFYSRTPAYMSENYELLTELNFDFDARIASGLYNNSKYYPFPQKWDVCSYAFYDGSYPHGDFRGGKGDYPEWGYYALTSYYVECSGGGWGKSYPLPDDDAKIRYNSRGNKSSFHMFIDASDRPGVVARLPFEEKLCKGSELFVSAWVKNAHWDSGSDDAAMMFTIMGVRNSENGEQSFTPIFRHQTGQIPATYAENLAKGNEWMQVYFSFINDTEVEYDSYAIQIDNRSASTNGGDMYVDDIRVYMKKPQAKVTQLSANCVDDAVRVNFSLDWNRIISRLGIDENVAGKHAIDFCFVDTIMFRNKMKELESTISDFRERVIQSLEYAAVEPETNAFSKFQRFNFKTPFSENKQYDSTDDNFSLAKNNKEEDGYYFFKGKDDGGNNVLTVDFMSMLKPNRPYWLLITDPTYDDGIAEAKDFYNDYGTPCAIKTEFMVQSRDLVRVNGEVIKPTTTYCAGKVLDFTVDLRIPNGEDYIEIKDGVYFDWFFGTPGNTDVEEEFMQEQSEFGYVSVHDALKAFREVYPDAETISDATPVNEKFTSEMKDLLLKYLNIDSTIEHYGGLALHRSKLDLTLRSYGLQMIIVPIKTLLSPGTGITDEQWSLVCWSYIPIMMNISGKSPHMHAGFNDLLYPNEHNPNIRIGYKQLYDISETKLLEISLREATFVYDQNGTMQPVQAIEPIADYEHFKYIYLVGTNDPEYESLFEEKASHEFDYPIGYLDELHAELYKEGSSFNDYMKIHFDYDGTLVSEERNDFKFRPKEGYWYTFSVYFEEVDKDGVTTRAACEGQFNVTMIVVPEYLVWNDTKKGTTGEDGTVYTIGGWNNDDNWKRATREQLNMEKSGDIVYPNSESHAYEEDGRAYTPMYFSKVIIPAGSQVELYRAGHTQRLWWDNFKPDYIAPRTTNIEYDMMIFEETDKNGYNTERFRANLCNQIHIEPEAEVLHAEYLAYTSAWIDYELLPSKWYLLSSPLHGVFAGDYYTKKGGRETAEYFKPIVYSATDNSRFQPSVYQRAWSQTADMMLPGSGTSSTTSAMAITGNWSSTYNDVTYYCKPSFGYSMKVQDVKDASGKALIRLPKSDTGYSYYDKNGSAGSASEELNRGDQAGRLISDQLYGLHGEFSPEKESVPITFTLENNNQTVFYLVGNPFTAHVDIRKFFEKNTQLLRKYWVIDSDEQGVAVGTDDGWISSAESTSALTIPPLRAFFVQLADETNKVLTFTADMQLLGTNEEEADSHSLRIKASAGGKSSKAVVHYAAGADPEFQENEDAELFLDSNLSDVPMVYTVAGSMAVSINQTNDLYNIPVGTYGGSSNDATLTFSGTEQFGKVSLYDAVANKEIPLPEGASVQVKGNTCGRYYLRTGVPTGNEPIANAQLLIYTMGRNRIVVSSTSDPVELIRVYQVDGTLMKEEKANDFYREVQMNPGIYIVKAQTAGGKEQTAKIRLR